MKLLAHFYQNPAGFLCSAVLLVFSVVSFFLNREASYIFIGAFIFVLIINVVYSALSLKTTRKYVRKVNASFSDNEIDSIEEFPLANVMCDMTGNIVWFNKAFENEIISEYDGRRLNMMMFFKGFKYSEFASLKSCNCEFNEKKYSVFITKIKSESKPMLSFYFFDDIAEIGVKAVNNIVREGVKAES